MTKSVMGMAIVLIVFCTLLITLRTLQRKCNPDPELVRKLFHIGMGLFTLSLPWLFAERWPVLMMCGVTVALLIAMRMAKKLQSKFGAVLGGVARCSHGEIYFSIGVAALFCLAKDDVVLYVCSILLLTFADAAAALIGQRFGRHHYQSISGQKSIEGSMAFLLVAVVCIAVPMLSTDLAVSSVLLIAVTVSLFLMLIEAMAARGLDNLFLPLAAYFLLSDLRQRTIDELGALLLFAILLVLPFTLASLKKHRKGIVA